MSMSVEVSQLWVLLPDPVRDALADGPDSLELTLFELGLSSMQLIEFATSVEEAYRVEFEPQEFLRLLELPMGGLVELLRTKSQAND
jgi:acyl carrier protein